MHHNLIIVSGPSGVGKTTLLKKLLEKYPGQFVFSISYTSRPMRRGEGHGIDYFFISHEEFRKKIQAGVFLEWAEVHGHLYGTSQEFIKNVISRGKYCILDIDVQGADQLLEKKIQARYIFIKPISIQVLKDRLDKRATDSDEIKNKRLKIAEKEMTLAKKYDYIITNDHINQSLQELENIIFSNKEITK